MPVNTAGFFDKGAGSTTPLSRVARSLCVGVIGLDRAIRRSGKRTTHRAMRWEKEKVSRFYVSRIKRFQREQSTSRGSRVRSWKGEKYIMSISCPVDMDIGGKEGDTLRLHVLTCHGGHLVKFPRRQQFRAFPQRLCHILTTVTFCMQCIVSGVVVLFLPLPLPALFFVFTVYVPSPATAQHAGTLWQRR